MPDLFPDSEMVFRIEELIGEMNRELEMRHQVYGRRVGAGSMTQKDADRKIALARAVIAQLQKAPVGTLVKVPKE